MTISSVLRMGGPLGSETSVDILKTELLHHFKPENETNSDGSTTNEVNLCVKNKYFTAQVQIAPFHEALQAGQKEDGILLVFPSASIPTSQTKSLTQIHDSLVDSGDTLRLCISTSVGEQHKQNMTEKEYEEQYAQRVLWCLDQGYEYIEVDLSEKGLTSGFDVREKDGFARVVEAMGGTVWSSAVMTEAKAKARRNIMECSTAVADPENPVESNEAKSEQPDVDHLENREREIYKNVTEQSPEHTEHKEEKQDEEQMAVLDDIEHLMKEAKIIRESAQNNDLSDDDRRQRAGDAAEMLMGLLDQLGFDEEDESDSSDEE